MRTTPRPRRPLGPVGLALLRPALRYSYTREAYVLRLIGNHRGPVFVRKGAPAAAVPAAAGGNAEATAMAGTSPAAPTAAADQRTEPDVGSPPGAATRVATDAEDPTRTSTGG